MGAAPTPRSRRLRFALVLGAAALALLASGGVPADAATKRYVSPRGSDRNPCTRSKPCRSFDHAYRAARPGQTVVVLRGTYGSQRIDYDWRKRSSRKVVFRPAAGQRVRVRGSLLVLARYVELRGFGVGAWSVRSPASGVILRALKAGRFSIYGASNVSVLGGTVGPSTNASNVIAATSSLSRRPPLRILLDGVKVQDFHGTGSEPVYCLDVRNVNGLTVRGSRFLDCETAALFFAEAGFAGPPANVVLENNVIACCRSGSYAVYLDGARGERWANFLVRNNSTDAAIGISPTSDPALGLDFYSNIARALTGCGRAGVAADFNVWEAGASCGANDRVAPSRFVDPDAYNFDLRPGAVAIDLSPAGNFASNDLTGETRPIGPAGDAGAYESTASGLVAGYGFNELAGLVAPDASGKGNDGFVSGAAWTAAGRFGGALTFDGLDDWVTVADAPSLDFTSAVTLEAWVRPAALGSTWRTVAMKEQPGNLVYALYANTDDRGASGHVFVGGDVDARAPTRLQLGKWTHVATTYDGSTLKLYVNGSEAGRRSVAGSLGSSSGVLRLGGNAVWSEWFAGEVDELRVYGRALPAKQIKKDMSRAVDVSSSTVVADAEAPTSPTGFAATNATSSSISLSWNASSDNVGVAGYGVYRNGSSVGSTAPGTRTFTLGGLACGTTYTLGVDAYDAAGNRSSRSSVSSSTSACSDTQPPSVPQGMAFSATTQTTVSLVWLASTDNVGVAGYHTYRDGTRVASTTSLTYTYADLFCGTAYTFALEAYDVTGNVSNRAEATGTTSTQPCSGGSDAQAPTAPSGLSVSGQTQTSVALSWSASSDNVGVAGYGVYRDGTSVGTTNSGARTYTFSGLACGTGYTLGVDAYDAAGNRSARGIMTVSTSSCSSSGGNVANLWVDSSGGTCTRSATSTFYADSAACASFDAAYDAASCGDVVRVKGGTYGDQTITGSRSCGGTWDQVSCSACVEVLEASGEQVTVGDLTAHADYLEINGVTSTEDWNISAPNVDHVICRNCDVNGVFYSGNGTDEITMIGGDVGPMTNGHPQIAPSWGTGSGWITDILFEGVMFHDVRCTDCSAYHVECMQVAGGTRITFRGNLWRGCDIFDLSLTEYNNSGPPTDFVIENNFFGAATNGGYYSFHLNSNASKIVRLVLQYNSSTQLFAISNATPLENAIVRGNLAPRPSCSPPGTVTFDNNVWTGGTCSPSDLSVGSLGFVDAPSLDFHIRADSLALGNGSSVCPSIDYDGESRPILGTTCDAGADERN